MKPDEIKKWLSEEEFGIYDIALQDNETDLSKALESLAQCRADLAKEKEQNKELLYTEEDLDVVCGGWEDAIEIALEDWDSSEELFDDEFSKKQKEAVDKIRNQFVSIINPIRKKSESRRAMLEKLQWEQIYDTTETFIQRCRGCGHTRNDKGECSSGCSLAGLVKDKWAQAQKKEGE